MPPHADITRPAVLRVRSKSRDTRVSRAVTDTMLGLCTPFSSLLRAREARQSGTARDAAANSYTRATSLARPGPACARCTGPCAAAASVCARSIQVCTRSRARSSVCCCVAFMGTLRLCSSLLPCSHAQAAAPLCSAFSQTADAPLRRLPVCVSLLACHACVHHPSTRHASTRHLPRRRAAHQSKSSDSQPIADFFAESRSWFLILCEPPQ
jgi:hypothetical protein